MARIYQGVDGCRVHLGGGIYAEFKSGDAWPGDPDAVLSAEWVEAAPTPPQTGKRAEKD